MGIVVHTHMQCISFIIHKKYYSNNFRAEVGSFGLWSFSAVKLGNFKALKLLSFLSSKALMLYKNQDTISLTSSQLKRRTYIKKITTSPSHQASKTVMKSPTWEITRRRPNESHVSSALIFSIKSLSKFVIAGQWENGSFGILPHGV